MEDNVLNRACHMEMRSRSKGKKPALTRPDTPPGSPSTNCAICLGVCDNKSYSDTCFHQFCFNCLLTWSQVKAECPLCKQRFNKIIHNIKSDREYDEHRVEQRTFIDDDDDISILQNSAFAAINNTSQRFRYRTTLTLERRHQNALEELLRAIPSALTTHEVLTGRAFHHGEAARTLGFLEVESPRPFAHAPGFGGRTRSATSARRTIYERGLYAYPLPDLTGRFRESSPEFYRFNQSQIHRLVPWLSREITAILPSSSNVAYIISMITDMLPEHSISSHLFATVLRPYFNEYTEHFAHEFSVFASTPYDITGYDRAVQYRHVEVMSEIVSDSDSRDSDIIEVPNPEPSHSDAVRPGRSTIDDVITIETIDNSDTDDSTSEVMVVGYIKPPEQRTPPVVDLVASDSDVILQEDTEPSSIYPAELLGEGSSGPLVKLSLRRKRPRIIDSDSDWDSGDVSTRRRKKRQPRTPSVSNTSTHRDTSDNDYSSPQSSSITSGWTSSASSGVDSSHSSSEDTVSHLPPRLGRRMNRKTSFSPSMPNTAACSSTCERRSSCLNCNTTRKKPSSTAVQNGDEKSAKWTKRGTDSTTGKRKRKADVLTDSTDSYYTAESSSRKKGKKKEKKSTKEKDKDKLHKKKQIKSSKSKEKKQRARSQSTAALQVLPSPAEHNIAGPSKLPWVSFEASSSAHVMPATSSSTRFLDTMSPSCSEDDTPKIKSVINVMAPRTPTEPQASCSVPKTNLRLKVSEADNAPGFPLKCESLLDIMNTAVLNPNNGVLACQSSSDTCSGSISASRLDTHVLSQVFTSLVDSSNDSEIKPLNLSFKNEN